VIKASEFYNEYKVFYFIRFYLLTIKKTEKGQIIYYHKQIKCSLYDNILEYMFYFEFYMPMTSQRGVTVDGALAWVFVDLDFGFSLGNTKQVLIRLVPHWHMRKVGEADKSYGFENIHV
jgi:hypothetical protein